MWPIEQGSYRSSIVKFPDFSSHGMTISLTLSKQQPYRTNVRNGTLYPKVYNNYETSFLEQY